MATMKIGTLEADITADTSGLQAAEKQITKTAKTMDTSFGRATSAVQRQFRGIAQAGRRFASSFRPMRGVVQQASFQLQDFAVQVGAGTNAMTAFSQQAPQLLSAFGPGGAVVGAIVGIGAAIGASLIPQLFKAKEETEDLIDITKELDRVMAESASGGVQQMSKALIELANNSVTAAGVEIEAAILKARLGIGVAAEQAAQTVRDAFGDAFDGLDLPSGRGMAARAAQARAMAELATSLGLSADQARELASALEEVDTAADKGEAVARLQEVVDALAATSTSEEFKLMASEMRESSSAAADLSERIEELVKWQKDIPAAAAAATEALNAQNKARQERIRLAQEARAQREADRIERAREAEMARRNRGVQEIERLGETPLEQIEREAEERRRFILQQDQLTLSERDDLLDQANRERERKIKEHNDRVQQIEETAADRQRQLAVSQQQAVVSSLSTLADAANDVLERAGKEGSAIAKAIFLAQKAIQVASIIAATEVAAANAASVSALGGPFAFFATQGAIRATGYASAGLVAGLAIGDTFGGGRQFGGTVSPQMAHPINEAGTPEILNQAGRQFLLPTGKGGTITPMKQSSGGGQANVTIISNGTPQTVTGTQVTRDEVAIMIDDQIKGSERKINASLSTGRGDTAASLRRGFRVDRRLT